MKVKINFNIAERKEKGCDGDHNSDQFSRSSSQLSHIAKLDPRLTEQVENIGSVEILGRGNKPDKEIPD